MLPLIEFKNKKILFAADLIPTVGHLPIPYLMGYDIRPLVSLNEKKPSCANVMIKLSFVF